MKEKVSYSKLALGAMYRATQEAIEKAAGRNLKIPVWRNGKVTFVEAKKEPNK